MHKYNKTGVNRCKYIKVTTIRCTQTHTLLQTNTHSISQQIVESRSDVQVYHQRLSSAFDHIIISLKRGGQPTMHKESSRETVWQLLTTVIGPLR